MAGVGVGFDADVFRTAIRAAMVMGAPPDETRQAKFVFPPGAITYTKNDVVVTNPRLDREGKPLDPDIKVNAVPGAEVTVPCGVEIVKADAEELPTGNFRPTKAIVTLLDTEHAKVVGCKEMVYNHDRYMFGYEPDALGMFDAGVFTMIFYALVES